MSDDEFGTEIEYDTALEETLQAAEKGGDRAPAQLREVPDIEDLGLGLSPFDEFRKWGSLSVSDLVGTLWCEVQFD